MGLIVGEIPHDSWMIQNRACTSHKENIIYFEEKKEDSVYFLLLRTFTEPVPSYRVTFSR